MRNDERFEIERAFDLLPHIVGSSWAVIWFRLNKIKEPTREEYRKKVLDYLKMMEPVFESYQADEKFSEIIKSYKGKYINLLILSNCAFKKGLRYKTKALFYNIKVFYPSPWFVSPRTSF